MPKFLQKLDEGGRLCNYLLVEAVEHNLVVILLVNRKVGQLERFKILTNCPTFNWDILF